jgi:hypothetical protein
MIKYSSKNLDNNLIMNGVINSMVSTCYCYLFSGKEVAILILKLYQSIYCSCRIAPYQQIMFTSKKKLTRPAF